MLSGTEEIRKMQTFNDLVFYPHPNHMFGGTHAQIFFSNGFGASVITGGHSYTTEGTYELALIKGEKENQKLCNSKPEMEGIHLTKQAVSDLLARIQELPHA